MADRAEVTKIVAYATTGKEDAVNVSRAVAYLILEPGTEEPDTTVKQGHVFAQILRRS